MRESNTLSLRDWFRPKKEPPAEWWEELRALQSAMRALELDWENTYDKIRRALARLGKRAAQDHAREERENGAASGEPQLDLSDPRVRGRVLGEARRRYNSWGS